MYLKSIEAVFTKREINNEVNVILFKIGPLVFKKLIPASIFLVEAPLKILY